jgi:uncharacterized protein YkwD
MPVRAFRQGRSVVLATTAFAVLASPSGASAQLPVVGDLPATTSLPATPDLAAPPSIAVIARRCPGARRAKGTRARRAAVTCLVNASRGVAGLRGFRSSRPLARAARAHARDMVRARYFAHQRSGGPSLSQRARRAGVRSRALGEAIAYGCGSAGTPASIVRTWLNSPPHRAILLSRGLGRVGIAVAGRAPVACGGRGGTFVLDAAG